MNRNIGGKIYIASKQAIIYARQWNQGYDSQVSRTETCEIRKDEKGNGRQIVGGLDRQVGIHSRIAVRKFGSWIALTTHDKRGNYHA